MSVQRLAQKALGRKQITLFAQHELHRIAGTSIAR